MCHHWATKPAITNSLTNLISILWIIQFGCSSALVYRQKIKDTYLEQVLNSCWDMISQGLINAAIDQWSKRLLLVIRTHDGHTVHCFCLFSDVCLLQTFLLPWPLKMLPVLTFSEYLTYQLPYKEYSTTVFKFCPFLCYQLAWDYFGVNRVTLLPTIAKLWCTKVFLQFFLDHSVEQH